MSRRTARAAAMQALYQLDTGLVSVSSALEYAFETTPVVGNDEQFARELVAGTLAKWEDIDSLVSAALAEWAIDRLARVDRSLLRLAVSEMLSQREDTSVGVIINECIELAKQYSTEESSRFVNGILGAIARKLSVNQL
ncbi:MAG: N utilization substance protein B [Firmicutes bacterium]|nr:N utilization substance protein B [Bacillota bacterium]